MKLFTLFLQLWVELYSTSDRHGNVERAAQLSTLVKQAKARSRGPVVLLDAGDLFTGTLESDLGEGAIVIRAMNAIGYDAVAMGNHDFDFGPVGERSIPRVEADDPRGAIKARVAEMKFPFLACNLVEEKSGKPPAFVKPFAILQRGGVKIGVVGGITEDTPHTTMAPNLIGLRVEKLAPSIARAAAEARKAGATVVIALVHAGAECKQHPHHLTSAAPGEVSGCKDGEAFPLARALAAEPPASRVDAILAGHTHQQLTAVVAGVPIAQPGFKALNVAHVGLELDEKTHKPTGTFSVELMPIEAAPDAAVQAAIAGDLEKASAMRARPIGVKLDGKLWREYRAESPFGNLMADVMREATQADIGLVNGGNLRADLPAGELTLGPLFEALPFANRLAVLKMTGAQFKHLIAANLTGDHGLLSLGGARLEAKCENGAVVPVVTMANGKQLADGDAIRVGVSDFLAMGGDDFAEMKGEVELHPDGPTMRDAFAEALRKRGVIKAAELYDTAHPRIKLAVPKPMRCK